MKIKLRGKIPNRRVLNIALFFIVCCISSFSHQKEEIKWELVWTEDFNGDSIDSSIWGFMKRRKDDSRKYHSSSSICYDLKDGKLILKGIKNPDLTTDSANYLTGGITTEGKKAFHPGRIEIKAKFGSAKGAWPAIWLLPYKRENGWPADGEIDIMEHLNFDDYVYQTVHSSYTTNNRNAFPQRYVKVPIDNSEFNIYRVDIHPSCLCFYVNNKETLYYPKIDSLQPKGEFPYYRDWFLMLDMQLGGNWVGNIESSHLPVVMEIDWIKYYQPVF